MARDCFCGCGRKVERRDRGLNKRAAELRFLTEAIESHSLVFQRAYAEFAARRELDSAEIAEAGEGVRTTEELIALSRVGQRRIADSIHQDAMPTVNEGDVKSLLVDLKAMDANVRKYCFQSGLDYGKIPELGTAGIIAFVEERDAQTRSGLLNRETPAPQRMSARGYEAQTTYTVTVGSEGCSVTGPEKLMVWVSTS